MAPFYPFLPFHPKPNWNITININTTAPLNMSALADQAFNTSILTGRSILTNRVATLGTGSFPLWAYILICVVTGIITLSLMGYCIYHQRRKALESEHARKVSEMIRQITEALGPLAAPVPVNHPDYRTRATLFSEAVRGTDAGRQMMWAAVRSSRPTAQEVREHSEAKRQLDEVSKYFQGLKPVGTPDYRTKDESDATPGFRMDEEQRARRARIDEEKRAQGVRTDLELWQVRAGLTAGAVTGRQRDLELGITRTTG